MSKSQISDTYLILNITNSAMRFDIIDILYDKGDRIELDSWEEVEDLLEYLTENNEKYTAFVRTRNNKTQLVSVPSSYNSS